MSQAHAREVRRRGVYAAVQGGGGMGRTYVRTTTINRTAPNPIPGYFSVLFVRAVRVAERPLGAEQVADALLELLRLWEGRAFFFPIPNQLPVAVHGENASRAVGDERDGRDFAGLVGALAKRAEQLLREPCTTQEPVALWARGARGGSARVSALNLARRSDAMSAPHLCAVRDDNLSLLRFGRQRHLERGRAMVRRRPAHAERRGRG